MEEDGYRYYELSDKDYNYRRWARMTYGTSLRVSFSSKEDLDNDNSTTLTESTTAQDDLILDFLNGNVSSKEITDE